MITQLIITILWIAYGILCYSQDRRNNTTFILILYISFAPIVLLSRIFYGAFNKNVLK